MHTTYPSALTLAIRKPLGAVLAVLAVAVVPVWLYLQLFREALIDDTFITLQYARTLRDHGVWGFFPWEVTNTATSPLNVILTAATGLLVPDLIQATLLLATVEALILLGCLLMLSLYIFHSFYFGVAGFVALMLNPLLISTIGLEPLLYVTLLVACIYAFVIGRYTLLAVLLALLTLTRPDGFLLVPIMLGAIVVTNRGNDPASTQPLANPRSSLRSALRIAARVFGVCLLCLAPWYLFSWLYLGSLVPITLLIKREQGNWEGYNFFNGVLFYYQRYPREVPLTLLLVPFALLCLRLENRKASIVAGILLLFSSLYFLAYVTLGVPPYHWYFVPAVIPWSLLGILGLTALAHRVGAFGHQLTKLGLYAVLCVIGLVGIVFFTNGTNGLLAESPIHTNWATHNRYREIGLWLRDNVDAQANVQLWGEIGTVAYYSERRLVDIFSCRLNNRAILQQNRALRGVPRLIANANFYWLKTDTACTPPRYELVMYNYDVSVVDLPPNEIKQWLISTDWVRIGKVVLARRY